MVFAHLDAHPKHQLLEHGGVLAACPVLHEMKMSHKTLRSNIESDIHIAGVEATGKKKMRTERLDTQKKTLQKYQWDIKRSTEKTQNSNKEFTRKDGRRMAIGQ